MALGTTPWHHIDMGETRAHPRCGAMASVARGIGGQVIRRFALNSDVVMALAALVRRYTNVTEKGNTP